MSGGRGPAAVVRATESRQFVPPEPLVKFTCAAIAPQDANAFAVTGTKTGGIYVWPMPTERDALKLNGTLKFIDQNAAANSRQVRIWADFDNTTAKLRPGGAVTVVIEPVTK